MTKYDISYDRPGKSQDYSEIIDVLRGMGARKYQQSGWYLESSLSATELHSILSPYFDWNDRLKVAEINPMNMVSTNEIGNFSAFFDLFSAPSRPGNLSSFGAKSAVAAALARDHSNPSPAVGILSEVNFGNTK